MTLIRKNFAAAIAAVLIVIGAVGWWMAIDPGGDSAADNRAIIDATTTAEVQAEVSSGLTQVLSYDYADPSRTTVALDAVLAGDARKQYDILFEDLQKNAPGQQLTMSAEVKTAAVKELSDTEAKLLVFLDQRSERAGDKEASISAAQLAITAEKIKGAWLITGFKPL